MNTNDKLQLIKSLTGKTQEMLAHELGVSFATVNSWFNSRSEPHRRKVLLIDELLFKYSGLKISSDDTLLTKKTIIATKARQYPDILRLIRENIDLYEEFILSLTYNTNKIEGSTLSEDETAAIIFRNEVIKNKNLREHLEAKNHQSAIKYLLDHLQKGKLDEKLILHLHGILMNGVRDDAGLYRRHGVRIVGSHVPTANYLRVAERIKTLVKDINKKNSDIIEHVAVIHSRFEQIHPFSDGNGRVGRLILIAMLILSGLPPAIILAKQKSKYLKYLRLSQLKGDHRPLIEFICDAVLVGFQKLKN